MDKEIKLLASGVLVAVVAIICAWSWRFWEYEILLSSTGDWAAFGSFLGGVLGPFFSLVTIVYLFRSYRKQASRMDDQMESMQKQSELMQKQMELLREQVEREYLRDDREMLMNELRVLSRKIGELCENDIEFVAIAEDYLPLFYGEKVKYDVIDRHMVDVDGYRLYGGLISALGGLEAKANLAAVHNFIAKCKEKRRRLYSDLLHIEYAFRKLVDLSFRALERGARVDVVKSIVLQSLPHAASLAKWGYFSQEHYIYLQVLRDLPDDETAWHDYVSEKFFSELSSCQDADLSSEEVKFTIKLDDEEEKHVEGYYIEELCGERVWMREGASVWEKAS